MILKTSESIESTTQPKEGVVRVGGDSRVGHNKKKLDRNEIDDNEVDSGKIDDKIEKKDQKTSKSKNSFTFKKLSKSKKLLRSDFFTPRARLAFTKLRQAFVKALIFYHFDSECHIWVETDASDYVIGRIFSQLTLEGQ